MNPSSEMAGSEVIEAISLPSPSGRPRTRLAKATPIRCPVCRPNPSRNSRGSQFSQPRPSMYAAWAASDSTPLSKVSVVSTPCSAAASRPPTPAVTPPQGSSPSTSCSGKTQRLPASRTASSTARPVAMWSAWLRLRPPNVSRKLPVITISGPVLAHHGREHRAATARRTRGSPSGWREELDDVDADDPRRLDLLGLAHAAALVGLHPVDAGLAGGDHAVDDLLALRRSSARPRPRSRTPCRRGARRSRARGSSPRAVVRAVVACPWGRACRELGWPHRGRSRLAGRMIEIAELDDVDDEATPARVLRRRESRPMRAERPYAVLRTFPRSCARWPRAARSTSAAPSSWPATATRSSAPPTSAVPAGQPPPRRRSRCGVLPEARRRGIGRALHDEVVRRGRADGRTTFIGEAYPADRGESSAGSAFARALGYDDVPARGPPGPDLPVPRAPDGRDRRRAQGPDLDQPGARRPGGGVRADADPDAARHAQRVSSTGSRGADRRATARGGGARRRASYDRLVAVAQSRRRRAGRLLDGVPAPRPRLRPAGRHDGDGRRTAVSASGRALKSAVLGILAADRPERGSCTPGTPSTTRRCSGSTGVLGFRPVELMHGDAAQGRRCLSGTTRCRSATGRSRSRWGTDEFRDELRAWCEAHVGPLTAHGAAQAARLGDGLAGDDGRRRLVRQAELPRPAGRGAADGRARAAGARPGRPGARPRRRLPADARPGRRSSTRRRATTSRTGSAWPARPPCSSASSCRTTTRCSPPG